MHPQRFTLSFTGDLRKMSLNPLRTPTPFGEACAASVDDEMLRLSLIEQAETDIDDHADFRDRVCEIIGMDNAALYAAAASE